MNALLSCFANNENMATGGYTYYGIRDWQNLGGTLDQGVLD